MLLEKRRIAMQEDFGVWFSRTAQDLELLEASLNWQVVHDLRFILPNHRDPAHRFLAATAVRDCRRKTSGRAGSQALANV